MKYVTMFVTYIVTVQCFNKIIRYLVKLVIMVSVIR